MPNPYDPRGPDLRRPRQAPILLGDALRVMPERRPHLHVRLRLSGWEGVGLRLSRTLSRRLCGSPALATARRRSRSRVADVYGPHWALPAKRRARCEEPRRSRFPAGPQRPAAGEVGCSGAICTRCSAIAAPARCKPIRSPMPRRRSSAAFSDLVNQAMQGSVEVRLPFGGMKKIAVMRLGEGLPLEHTFSCINAIKGLHCGKCNKCAERQDWLSPTRGW